MGKVRLWWFLVAAVSAAVAPARPQTASVSPVVQVAVNYGPGKSAMISGVVVGEGDMVLTQASVLKGAREIVVALTNTDILDAEVLRVNTALNVALVRLEKRVPAEFPVMTEVPPGTVSAVIQGCPEAFQIAKSYVKLVPAPPGNTWVLQPTVPPSFRGAPILSASGTLLGLVVESEGQFIGRPFAQLAAFVRGEPGTASRLGENPARPVVPGAQTSAPPLPAARPLPPGAAAESRERRPEAPRKQKVEETEAPAAPPLVPPAPERPAVQPPRNQTGAERASAEPAVEKPADWPDESVRLLQPATAAKVLTPAAKALVESAPALPPAVLAAPFLALPPTGLARTLERPAPPPVPRQEPPAEAARPAAEGAVEEPRAEPTPALPQPVAAAKRNIPATEREAEPPAKRPPGRIPESRVATAQPQRPSGGPPETDPVIAQWHARLAAEPENLELRFQFAQALMQGHRYSEAVALLEQVQAAHPRIAIVYWHLGQALWQQGIRKKDGSTRRSMDRTAYRRTIAAFEEFVNLAPADPLADTARVLLSRLRSADMR